MKNRAGTALILWVSYFDELVAVSFASEFRQMGMRVISVALNPDSEYQKGEFVSPPRYNLQEALQISSEVDCLVIPASPAALAQFEQDPLLWRLIADLRQRGARIVIGKAEGQIDRTIARLLPPHPQLIAYPAGEKLLLFARWVAYLIVVENDQSRPGKSRSTPPLIKVASDSVPGSVAGAIAGVTRQYGYAEVQSVGAAAGNQMLKSIAIAKSYLTVDKLALFVVPDFATIEIAGFSHSAIRLFVSAWPTNQGEWIGWGIDALTGAVEQQTEPSPYSNTDSIT